MSGIKDYLFHYAPMFLKGPLLGLHSWLNAKKKYGPIYKKEVSALRNRALMVQSELSQQQRSLLADFLCEVYSNNAYYRNMMVARDLSQMDVRREPVEALMTFDILEKTFLKENTKLLTSESVQTCATVNTSGTTGSPMVVPYDSRGFQNGFAYWRRFYDQMGLGARFRNVRFSGRVLVGDSPRNRVFWVHDWFERRLFMSTYHMAPSNLGHYVAKLNSYRPNLIDGYPSALKVLASFIEMHRIPLAFSPQAIAVTAETLLEEDRKLIERVFGCKVFNQYASSEGAPFITECTAGKMHLNTDTGYFEFHDVEQGGDVKQLVVTSFRNLKLPLIRYRIGDTVQLDSVQEKCACGSAFPTIASIEGRLDDLVYSSERGAIGRLDPIYKGVLGIARSQIIQIGADQYKILVVPSPGYDAAMRDLLEMNFRDRVGHAVDVSILEVEEIPLSANGKYRSVINRCGASNKVGNNVSDCTI